MIDRAWQARSVAILASVAVLAPLQQAWAAPDWTIGPDFAVAVSLSPKAAARLAKPKETVVVTADFYGDSDGKAPRMENPVGQIVLAPSQKDEITGAGLARFKGPKYDKNRLADVDANGFQVLINVFSGRHSSPDNLLDCGLFQDKIAVAARGPIQIRCKLIGE